MLYWIDRQLNQTTTYRLLIYGLSAILFWAVLMHGFGWIRFSAWEMLVSAGVLIVSAWVVNWILATMFRAPVHSESAYITGLILALIVDPAQNWGRLGTLSIIAALAMAGKYCINWRHQHIFNPAALAVVVMSAMSWGGASWWVGTAVMVPATAIVGWLILRKMQMEKLFLVFSGVVFVAYLVLQSHGLGSWPGIIRQVLMETPLVFFGTIMLTEPVTMPGTQSLRYGYVALVGALFPAPVHLFGIYSTPELALVIGNMLGWIARPRIRLMLQFVRREPAAHNIDDFLFTPDHAFSYQPGQYLEVMMPHSADERGQRRYFTIASANHEPQVRFGMKHIEGGSSYKRSIWSLQPGQTIVASQLAGNFTLAGWEQKKMLWIAGGIGITPFRSFAAHQLELARRLDVIVFYAADQATDFAYQDIFRAAAPLGIQTKFLITGPTVPAGWTEGHGVISADQLRSAVPDISERFCMVSGPHGFVQVTSQALRTLHVPPARIRKDFFPGFA